MYLNERDFWDDIVFGSFELFYEILLFRWNNFQSKDILWSILLK